MPIFAGLRPSAPAIKNPLSLLPLIRSPSPHRVVGRHEVEVNVPRRSERFSAQCEDFRQGQRWEYSGVVWLDPHQDREVVILIKVTAANLHGEISQLFKLEKSVLSSRVFDLVDVNSGKVVKDYYVKPLVEEAIKEKKFGAFEWDRVSDEN